MDWVVGYWKNTYAYNHTHIELIVLQQGLQLPAARHMLPIKIEIDSIEAIQRLEQQHPTYQSIINSWRFLLRRLGNPVVRHSFCQTNTAAHVLAKEGSKQAMCNHLSVMVTPPISAMTNVQADNDEATSSNIVSISMCN